MDNTNNLTSIVYTTMDLTHVLQIGKDKAYALMQAKAFPSTRIGRQYFISHANLEAWLTRYAGREFVI